MIKWKTITVKNTKQIVKKILKSILFVHRIMIFVFFYFIFYYNNISLLLQKYLQWKQVYLNVRVLKSVYYNYAIQLKYMYYPTIIAIIL